MSKLMITDSLLTNIANAIRGKNGSSDEYTPAQMASAIANIPGGITPNGTVNITQNGTHDVTQYAEANVSVLPNLQSKTATQNGTVTPDSGYDGLSSVVVNVSGGGGVDIFSQATWLIVGANDSNSVKAMISNQLTRSNYSPPISDYYPPAMTFYNLKRAIISEMFYGYEYFGYIYGNTNTINGLNLTCLGDFSQGGAATDNVLSDSIQNYSAILLQGIYSKQRTSTYNTTIIYKGVSLNTAYWAGMKDRNSSYTCNVTFTDNTHCDLSGNKQVIIYGMP